MTDSLQSLGTLLDRARRRRLTQLVLEQAGVALAAALGGVVLLLLLGTQILDWYWLVALFVLTFGFGVWRTTRLMPSRYKLAQIIDGRLQLHDTLSTAYIYSHGSRKAEPELLDYQRTQAEKAAARVDARAVFPMHMPKALYVVGGVALVAFGMFAVRYGVTQSLDLKPSLVKIAFESVWSTSPETPPEKKTAFQKAIEEQLKKLGIDLGTQEEQKALDAAPESALETIDTPDVNNASNELAEAKGVNVKEQKEQSEGEGAEKGEGATGEEEPAGDEKPEAEGPQQGKNDGPQKGESNQANNNQNSLMDKMRDAMASLLNKLKMQPKGGEGKQQTAQNSEKKNGQGQKGQKSEGQPDSKGTPSADQQGDQQGEGDQQTAQGKSGDRNADQASNDSKSGMGKDDGDKSTKEAEQLAAMGKLTELLGKRAKDVSGELMVEVAGGNQQLKTAYSGKTGAHAESGGEITRDEVPLMYRDFVQQYFERVRKTPAPAAAKPKAAESLPGGKKPTKVTE